MLDLLFSLLSSKSRGCDLVPVLAAVAVLSVCLRRKKLARAIYVLFCLWGGVVLRHLALPMFSACSPASSRNMNSNVVRRGSRSGQSERRADVAVLGRPPAPAKGRSGLICLLRLADWGLHPPSQPTALAGGWGEEKITGFSNLIPCPSISLSTSSFQSPASCHICHSSQPTKGNPLGLLKQQQIKALFEACS